MAEPLIHATMNIEFRRHSDGLTYHFQPVPSIGGKPAWRRVDLAVWITHVVELGWATVDEHGQINGIPWAVPVNQQGALPPAGEWVSKKGSKSYVYDLVFVEQSNPALTP